jgi:hypothetical protein
MCGSGLRIEAGEVGPTFSSDPARRSGIVNISGQLRIKMQKLQY